jgi:uncharacterized protein YjhX (UPF0386 family)
MRFFSEAGMRRYLDAGKMDWSRLWRDYSEHLNSIDCFLSDSWRSFSRCDLHDQHVVRRHRPRKDFIEIDTTDYRIQFIGVRCASIPESGESAVWLYTEMDADAERIPSVHIWTTEGHWEIVSKDVRCEEILKEKKGSPTRRYRQPR